MTTPYHAAAHLKQVHDSVVHERHGIITALTELNESAIAEGLHVFHATIVNPLYFRENKTTKARSTRAGSGVSFNRTSALWSTIGEALERYAGSIYQPESFVTATRDELGDDALDLGSLILFSEEQYQRETFPFSRPDHQMRRHWTATVELGTGKKIWVPAELVYLAPELYNREKEIVQNASTGLACGQTLETATLSGLCEVIERDAFASMWQLGYSPTQILLDDETEARLSPGVRNYLKSGPLKISLWSLLTDVGVPVIMATAEHPRSGIFALGASCRLDPAAAIDKAIMEVLHGYVWVQKKQDAQERAPEVYEINSPETHMSYWLEPTRRELAEFLFADTCPMRSSSVPGRIGTLDQLVTRLRELDFAPLVADVTPSDIASLQLRVVRAIIPGMHPLTFGPDVIPEDSRRLRQLARFWEMTFPTHFNPLPHPFP